jgi:DNA-3-methyladenine glycosylase
VYIYLVYGMYWQLNLTTGKAGRPECVLIRALAVDGKPPSLANGPGKLCRWLKLDRSFYAECLTRSDRFWVEDRGVRVRPREIIASARIGIDYAGPYWSRRQWRFFVCGNPAVSRR